MDSSGWRGLTVFKEVRGYHSMREMWDISALNDSLAMPFVVTILLISILSLQLLFRRLWDAISRTRHVSDEHSGSTPIDNPTIIRYLTTPNKDSAGLLIFAYTIARLAGCLTLFALSMKTVFQCQRSGASQFPEGFMAFTFFCSSILSIISITAENFATLATRYNIVILLCTSIVYSYRDIWPLMTYTEYPKDVPRDELIWAKIVVLAFTAWVVPLFIPRRYIPVDPKDPMPVPNDEQTCSIFSLIFYFYLDSVILLGSRVKHLEADKLPPLSDTDYSKHLVAKSFPYLDAYTGAKKRHLFFGLMTVFSNEFIVMVILVVGQVIAGFLSPIGVNRILSYLETGGEGATIRPWFWIVCLFCGPSFDAVLFQWYIFLGTRMLAHTEALITQLIFEHSLRIRFIADSNDEVKPELVTHQSQSDIEVNTSAGSEGDSAESHENASQRTNASTTNTEPETTETASTQSKAKSRSPSNIQTNTPKNASTPKKDSHFIGKINNLVTTDLGNIVDARNFLLLVMYVPLQVAVAIVFLYILLGWSAFVGLGTMIVLLPVPGYTSRMLYSIQELRMSKTDAKVQAINEVVGVLRMVKLFGWEREMSKRIDEKREEELSAIWKYKTFSIVTRIFNVIIPTITMVATYATYTTVMQQSLTPSVIFSSLTIFSMIRGQLFQINHHLSTSIQGKVSLDRISEFLRNTELLDSFETRSTNISEPVVEREEIGFHHAAFSWRFEGKDGTSTPSRRQYRLEIKDELIFKPNCINLIVGPTGSGKTSILMALLGEMHFIGTSADSWFNLPRTGGIAYAAQESWVQNETIRDNILFGFTYDEDRYRKVLYQCALEKDLDLFEAGDATEVGERGITLSGGQKARITLARAIYSQAKILLLDDVLAALDVHTAVWIVNKCFKGDLVQNRTILLVTHNVALLAPVAGLIISLSHDGTIEIQVTDSEMVLSQDLVGGKDFEQNRELSEIADQEMGPVLDKREIVNNGKLIVAEEIAKGRITFKSFNLYLSALAGDHPILFFCLFIGGFMAMSCVNVFQAWFLGYWGSQYESHDPQEVSIALYLSLYCAIVFTGLAINISSNVFYIFAVIRALRKISSVLIDSVMTSTLRWLDETPMSRIIARCTQDIRVIDGELPEEFLDLVRTTIGLIVTLGGVVVFTPIFMLPGMAVAALGLYLGDLYLKASLAVRRERSNARAPVLAHFSAAISGIVSVRAYGAQATFKAESLRRIDRYTRINRMSFNLNRWIGIRADLLGSLFTVTLASYLVYGTFIGSSNTGFSLTMAVDFCNTILFWVRVFNDLELQSNSLERVQDYVEIDHEPAPTKEGQPPAAWPKSGDLIVENLSARYSKDGPAVLHGLSFHIESGQRVGIVGRTGSGKSSLTLALLRCILTEGTVYYDGIPTNRVNLDALRSNITIIPQTPELISGSLRRNLDPFEQYDDATLNDALRSAGLFSVHNEDADRPISLDSQVSTGGGNLSVGERQIIALARAMVRGTKLLILDEATSAIDYKTDAVIQTTLRHKLDTNTTVITVAHRLQTIMDADKIMVLDEGLISEFDTPQALLQMKAGMFKALVDESSDKLALYSMAENKMATTSGQQ